MEVLEKNDGLTIDPHQLIDALSAEVAVVQQDGTIAAVNQAWLDFAGANSGIDKDGLGVGANYLDVCARAIEKGDDYALKALVGIRNVLDGRKRIVRIEYPCDSPEQERWFTMRITPLKQDDEIKGVLLSHQDTTRRKHAENRLRESENKYRQQFENSLYGILITCPDGRILDANPAAQMMLDRTAEQIREEGRSGILDMEAPNSLKAIEKRKKERVFKGELTFIKADGTRFPVELTSNIYTNAEGEERSIIIFRDLSEQRNIESELVREKMFSESVINSLPGILSVINEEGKLVQWNHNVFELGYSNEELYEINPIKLAIEEDRPRLKEALEKAWEKGRESTEVRFRAKDGSVMTYYITGVRFNSGDRKFIISTGINIDERIKMEHELRFNKKLFSQLFDNSPIGIALVDKEGHVNMTNPGFERIFGYGEKEAVGRKVDELLVPEKYREEAVKLTADSFSGDSFQKETFRVSKEGRIVPVLVAGVPVLMDGKAEAIFAMYVDITERKRLEDQVQAWYEKERAERMRIEEMFEQAPSAICLLEGPEHRFSYANQAYKKLVGNRPLKGKKVTDALPEVVEQGFAELLDSVYQSGEPYMGREMPINLENENGETCEYLLDFIYKPMKAPDGSVNGIFVEALDVTERVNNRKQLEKSLHEKNILLQEVHHRVKNNLALINSLLELQKFEDDKNAFTSLLKDTQNRIFSIAKIHEVLYKNQNLAEVSFDDYIDDLSGAIQNSYSLNTDHIELDKKLASISMNVNQAIPCGLLFNEILTNAYKHAFPNDRKGKIQVELSEMGEEVLLRIKDDGVGLPDKYKWDSGKSLGVSLMKTLTKQLDAHLDIENGEGTEVKVRFKKSDASGSSNHFMSRM